MGYSVNDTIVREHEEAARAKRVLFVDSAGTVLGSLPISASSLPLPTNAAQETGGNLASIKTKTDNLDILLSALRDAITGASPNNKTLNDLLTRLNLLLADATFTGRIGEVQASPTANTVLARLKDLLTGIVLAAGSSTIGNVNILHAKTLKTAQGTASTSGNNTIVAAVTGKKIKVFAYALTIISTTAVTCIFQSGAGGTGIWRVALQSPASVTSGANLAVPPPAHLFETAASTLLNLNLSGAVTVHYAVAYFDDDAS